MIREYKFNCKFVKCDPLPPSQFSSPYERSFYNFQPENLQSPGSLSEADYQQLLTKQKIEPEIVLKSSVGVWWMYKGCFYFEDHNDPWTSRHNRIPLDVKSEILKLDQKRLKDLEHFELQKKDEAFDKFDEVVESKLLEDLLVDDLKIIISAREERYGKLSNALVNYEKEYEEWVLNGTAAVQKAYGELLKPGDDIKQLEEYIGKIPVHFLGKGKFETSQMYKKWNTRINNAKRALSYAKKFLGSKLKESYNFPDTFESEELIRKRRELITDEVKIYVWRRDKGKCCECGGREKLEYDHIIPFSEGGSSTERNIRLLCERCNRSKGASLAVKTKK